MSKILFNLFGYFLKSAGDKCLVAGNLPAAQMQFSRALKWFEKSQNINEGFNCQIQLGNIYKASYMMDVAKEMFFGALEFAKRHENPDFEVIAMINIAMLYASYDDYENSKKTYEDAILIANDNPEMSGRVLHNYGVLEQQQGNFEKSKELLNKSIDKYDEIDLISPQGLVYSDLGEVYSALNDDKGAFNAWRNSLMVYQRNNDAAGMADIFLNLGQLEGNQEYIIEAMNANNTLNRLIPYANCCTTLALLYMENNIYDEAEKLLIEALQIDIDQEVPSAVIRDYANLALLNKKMENEDVSKSFIDKAMIIAEEIGDDVIKQELVSFFSLNSDGK